MQLSINARLYHTLAGQLVNLKVQGLQGRQLTKLRRNRTCIQKRESTPVKAYDRLLFYSAITGVVYTKCYHTLSSSLPSPHYWCVARTISARSDVYAMMMGWLSDDQISHNPDYIDNNLNCVLAGDQQAGSY